MRTILTFLLLASTCFGQFDMTVTKRSVLEGLKNPQIVAGVVFYESGTPVVSEAGVVELATALPLKDIIVEAENLDTEEFVDLSKPVADGYQWILKGPGRFRVTADAWSEAGRFRKRENITLGKPTTPGPGPVDPPPVNKDWKALGTKLVTAINDPPTTAKLKEAISYTAKTFTDDMPLDKAKNTMVTSIESVLLLRTGPSRNKDWINGFRFPLQTALMNLKTTKEYREAWLSIAEGM